MRQVDVTAFSSHHRQNIGGLVTVGRIHFQLEWAWKLASKGYKVTCEWREMADLQGLEGQLPVTQPLARQKQRPCCEVCELEATQGLEPCAGCATLVCALCRVYRVSADPDGAIWHHWCKATCDPRPAPKRPWSRPTTIRVPTSG